MYALPGGKAQPRGRHAPCIDDELRFEHPVCRRWRLGRSSQAFAYRADAPSLSRNFRLSFDAAGQPFGVDLGAKHTDQA
jgi:hypothetical protein